jgi:hypothetical protein
VAPWNASMRSLHIDMTNPAYKYLAVASSDAPNSPAQVASSKIAAMKYVNFDVNSKAYSVFFLHDYSWKEHGYALVNRFYQGFAQMLDAEWDGIFGLTYNTVSDQKNIDTTPFRRAIWYFTQRSVCQHRSATRLWIRAPAVRDRVLIRHLCPSCCHVHRLFGLQHDDFNYNKIPVFLTNSLKTFIKKLVCAPETITQADYELTGYSFQPSEKCHIVLLAIEARRQASLLYALHSVMQSTPTVRALHSYSRTDASRVATRLDRATSASPRLLQCFLCIVMSLLCLYLLSFSFLSLHRLSDRCGPPLQVSVDKPPLTALPHTVRCSVSSSHRA